MNVKELKELINTIMTLDNDNEISIIESRDNCYSPDRYKSYDIGRGFELLIQMKPYKEIEQKEPEYIKIDKDIIEVRYIGECPDLEYFESIERLDNCNYKNTYIAYLYKRDDSCCFSIYEHDENNDNWIGLIGYDHIKKPKDEVIPFAKRVVDAYRRGDCFDEKTIIKIIRNL